MIAVIGISGWSIYQTACFLVEGMGSLGNQGQRLFNAILLQYLWIFSIVIIVAGGSFHFYFTKKLINPLRQLIRATKLVKKGEYPDPINIHSTDEVGVLIEQFNDLIEQLQKNEIHRQKLVSNLSHEFRTPLSNLKGYLDALRTGVIQGDEKLYTSLYDEATRMTLMIDQLEQLKEWDHIHSQVIMNKENIDIAKLVEQSVSMFKWKLTQSKIPFSVDVESKEIFTQVEGVQQIINNLIENAIQYYDGKGKITIKGQLIEKDYWLSVTGPSHSIPDAEIDDVFERFYRLDHSRNRETGGTGLGLAIAKEIVEKLEGKIGIKKIKQQNMFWFTIPIDFNKEI